NKIGSAVSYKSKFDISLLGSSFLYFLYFDIIYLDFIFFIFFIFFFFKFFYYFFFFFLYNYIILFLFNFINIFFLFLLLYSILFYLYFKKYKQTTVISKFSVNTLLCFNFLKLYPLIISNHNYNNLLYFTNFFLSQNNINVVRLFNYFNNSNFNYLSLFFNTD